MGGSERARAVLRWIKRMELLTALDELELTACARWRLEGAAVGIAVDVALEVIGFRYAIGQ